MKTKNKDKKRHKDRCSFDIEGEERKCDTLMLNDSDAHYHLINERQNLHVCVAIMLWLILLQQNIKRVNLIFKNDEIAFGNA